MGLESKRKAREQKKSSIRKKRQIRFFLILAALFLLLYLGRLITNTDYFLIKNIEIKGNVRLLNDEILEIVKMPSQTGIFKIKTADIQKKLNGSPWIMSSQIVKKLPDTIIININEEKALAVLKTKNEQWLLSRQCVALEKIEKTPNANLIEIRFDGSLDIELGNKVKNKQIVSVVEIINTMGKRLKEDVSYINFINRDVYAMLRSRNVQIIYGDSSKAVKKNYIVEKILDESKRKADKLYYIDVRVPSTPTIKKIPTAKEIQG